MHLSLVLCSICACSPSELELKLSWKDNDRREGREKPRIAAGNPSLGNMENSVLLKNTKSRGSMPRVNGWIIYVPDPLSYVQEPILGA